MQIEPEQNASGALSMELRDSGTAEFWRLAHLLITRHGAIPLERPLEGLDQLYWRLRLADGATVMLCEDTMVGVSLDAGDPDAEESLRALAHALRTQDLGTMPIAEVRTALEPALAAFTERQTTREEIQAAAGYTNLVGLLIGALAPSLAAGAALLTLAAVAVASWRRWKRTGDPGWRGFARDLVIAVPLTVFAAIAAAARSVIHLWWNSRT